MKEESISIETKIKARATSLGFSLTGIASPEPLFLHQRYLDWVNQRHHAGMAYLASQYHVESRKDPHTVFPDVQSIIVLGLSYTLHNSVRLNESGIGLISGYAAGEDYHTRIPRMLDSFISIISREMRLHVTGRVFTDSAPILERELGVRAGLGWIGKNSCLISPHVGSNYLLAEVFIDQKLIPDTPFSKDYCGNCTRCVDACPTKCILPDRTIDANKCISFHTIENRGEIPQEVIPHLGNWIFGCDVCQMVCPWNKHTSITDQSGLQAELFTHEQMLSIIKMNEQEYKMKFASSAIDRAGRSGLLQTILINLGKTKSGREALKGLLERESDPLLIKLINLVLNRFH